MRFRQSLNPQVLRSALKARQFGVSFRQQVRCHGRVDGACHARRLRADERRELKLRRLGFRVSCV
jgi:very-short-patch-repair endonuclease